MTNDFEVNPIGTAQLLARLQLGAGGRYLPPTVPINCEIDGETLGAVYRVQIKRGFHGELCLMISTDPTIAAHASCGRGSGRQLWPTPRRSDCL